MVLEVTSSSQNMIQGSSLTVIDSIRDTVLQDILSGQLEVHNNDYNLVKHQGWFIQKFIDFNMVFRKDSEINDETMVQQVTKKMRKTLKFRLDNNVHDVPGHYVPKELLMFSHVLRQSVRTNPGNIKVIYMDASFFRRIDQSLDMFLDSLFYIAERELLQHGSDGKTVVLFIDIKNFALENTDPMLAVKMAWLLLNAYSFMGYKMIVYEPAWYIRPVIRLFKSFFPSKYLNLLEIWTGKDALKDEFFKQNILPDILGGNVSTMMLEEVKDSSLLHEIAVLKSIKYRNYAKMRNHFESLLPENLLNDYIEINHIPEINSDELKKLLQFD